MRLTFIEINFLLDSLESKWYQIGDNMTELEHKAKYEELSQTDKEELRNAKNQYKILEHVSDKLKTEYRRLKLINT